MNTHPDGIDHAPSETPAEPSRTKKKRGFAAMDRAKVQAIARLGGVAAHRYGAAHRFSGEEARVAGRKGGLAPHRKRGRAARPSTDPANADDIDGAGMPERTVTG